MKSAKELFVRLDDALKVYVDWLINPFPSYVSFWQDQGNVKDCQEVLLPVSS